MIRRILTIALLLTLTAGIGESAHSHWRTESGTFEAIDIGPTMHQDAAVPARKPPLDIPPAPFGNEVVISNASLAAIIVSHRVPWDFRGI